MRLIVLCALLAGCATTAPTATTAPKSAIPGDLVLVCYQGQYAIYSQEAQEARILPIQRKDDSDI